MHARYHETDDAGATVTRAYAINQPDPDVPFTRTVETKHASGQLIRGTIVCEEYPGHPAKHYPVPTADHEHERRNRELQALVRRESPIRVAFCGRLANYQYTTRTRRSSRVCWLPMSSSGRADPGMARPGGPELWVVMPVHNEAPALRAVVGRTPW